MSVEDPHEAERELRDEPPTAGTRDGESLDRSGRVRPVPADVDPRPERDRDE